MHLLVDQNIPKAVASDLEVLGYKVSHVADLGDHLAALHGTQRFPRVVGLHRGLHDEPLGP